MVNDHGETTCTSCLEPIKHGAKTCKHCGSSQLDRPRSWLWIAIPCLLFACALVGFYLYSQGSPEQRLAKRKIESCWAVASAMPAFSASRDNAEYKCRKLAEEYVSRYATSSGIRRY
ncbi:hypothetical protein [Pseudomonas tohonis]|uniref:hypothetical protein n=1 Tax=Pseudomonas tohonis TaxID=2725477 RepID=UPI001F4742EF|nr:hypothetical protein [Pseudomonas tohonis]